MGYVKIHCHCGKRHLGDVLEGSGGWWDCDECGCSYAYKNVSEQMHVKKMEKCKGYESEKEEDDGYF